MTLLTVRLRWVAHSTRCATRLANRMLTATRLPAFALIVGIAATAVCPSAVGEALPKIAAVVNGQPIASNELATAAIERHGKMVLDGMVNRQLILEGCQKRGIEVTEDEVNAEIKRMADKFNLSLDQYVQLLRDERGIDPGRYGREIIWPTLALRSLAADRIKVTQEDFDAAYIARYGAAVKCRHIMVSERSKAEQLLAEVRSDPSQFAELAKQHSEDEFSASLGGLIPPIRRGTSDTRLEEAAFALADGEVSDILRMGDQWVILQSVRRIPATRPSPEAIPTIKVQIRDQIRERKVREASGDIFETLQKEVAVTKVLGDDAAAAKHPGLAAIVGSQTITLNQLGAECIDRFGEDVLEITISRRLVNQALRAAKVTVTQQDLIEEVNRAAVAYGFVRPDGSADTDRWLDAVTQDGLSRQTYVDDSIWPTVALKKLVADQVEVTDEDMQRGYVNAYGPRAEVLAIVLSDQRSAQKVWKAARDAKTEAAFGELAERYSVEPISASNQGKIPPIPQYGGQPAIEKAAFKLKPGELSGIIVTGGQYFILRSQGMTDPVVTDPASVQEELRRDLTESKYRQAMVKQMNKLRSTAQVENYLAKAK